MPRVEFDNVAEMHAWLDQMIEAKRKYLGYFTNAGELIIQPITSTAPVTYGYVFHCIEGEAKRIQDLYEIPVITCKRFEWTSENQIKRDD